MSAHAAFEAAGVRVTALHPTSPCSAVTVDVEEWFDHNFRSAPQRAVDGLPRRVEEGVERALELLAETDRRGTFFVLGEVASRHPEAVRRIAAAGHEVGCHHWSHELVYEQSPTDFEAALRRAKLAIEDQAQKPVLGFRAPSWSISERSLWALEIVARLGFRYDSSIFPAANYLYGIAGAPRSPYRMHLESGRQLLELPPSVLSVGGWCLGVGGGFYLRVLPLAIHRWARRGAERAGRHFVAYVHPRELDPGAWALRLELSPFEQWLHRFRLPAVPRTLAALVADGDWRPLAEIAGDYDAAPSLPS